MSHTAAQPTQDWHERAAALQVNGQAFIDGRYVAAVKDRSFPGPEHCF